MNEESVTNIAIIGGPGVGKTSIVGQLLIKSIQDTQYIMKF